MKSLRHHAQKPAATALMADDVLEFHAGRLVLLLSTCGGPTATINGLTKMAKLDFFVRYPDFFDVVQEKPQTRTAKGLESVEAAMVRHHYGPWDKRYYHVLAYLEAKDLITIKKTGKSFRLALTKTGKAAAKALAASAPFETLLIHMRRVAAEFSGKTGNELKSMIYATFDQEVGKKALGDVIERSA